MIRAAVLGVALVALAGCAGKQQVLTFTAGDLANASALAKAGGDTVASACWGALSVATAATPQPQQDGLAVLAERKRLATGAVEGPCSPIVGPLLLEFLARVTPAPLSLLVP